MIRKPFHGDGSRFASRISEVNGRDYGHQIECPKMDPESWEPCMCYIGGTYAEPPVPEEE